MPRANPAIRASPARGWLTLKIRCRNTRAKVKTTARVRAVARILVKTRAKEREAAQPTEASRSSNQTLAAHIGGGLGRFRVGGEGSGIFLQGLRCSRPFRKVRAGPDRVSRWRQYSHTAAVQ